MSDVVCKLTSRLHEARQEFADAIRTGPADSIGESVSRHATAARLHGEIKSLEQSIRLISDAMCDGIKMDSEDMLDTVPGDRSG